MTLFLIPSILSGTVEYEKIFTVVVANVAGTYTAYLLNKLIKLENQEVIEKETVSVS